MKRRIRWRWVLGLGCVAFLGSVGFVWGWVIPQMIVARIREHHNGYVTIRGWWINRSSAGVVGLALHESPSSASPVWATAERATSDLSLGAFLRGRFTPRRIRFRSPRVVYRIGRDGVAITRFPLKRAKTGSEPVLIAERGRLIMTQEGRPEMVVEALYGRLEPGSGRTSARFEARSSDRNWGLPEVVGSFGPGFQSVRLRLKADRLPADLQRASRIPFITPRVWSYFIPTGPVKVVVDYSRPRIGSGPSEVCTVVDFEQTEVRLPHLQLTSHDTLGRMIYRNRLVQFEEMRGDLVGGRVSVDGIMDFKAGDSQYALRVGVEKADVVTLPRDWGLGAIGLEGRLSGLADLKMTLTGNGLDMTGSTGQGTIEEASVRGIPLGRLGLRLRGDGLRPAQEVLKTGRSVFLPQWLGSEFEVRDVAIERAVARIDSTRGPLAIPVSGRLDLRLTLRIPLGTLKELGDYRGRGRADLAGATIGSLSLGRVTGQVALAQGVLDVTEIQGRMAERAARDVEQALAPLPVWELPEAGGAIPPGGFRGRFQTDLATNGPSEAEFQGEHLPLNAIEPSATGAFSIGLRARGTSLAGLDSWSGSGRVSGEEVGYGSSHFQQVSAGITLGQGQFNVSELKAMLAGRQLTGHGKVGVDSPHRFEARIEGSDLSLAEILAVANSSISRGTIAGKLRANAELSGTLRPWRLESRGQALIQQAEANRLPIGELPISWDTHEGNVVVTAREIQRYGGRLSAEAWIPVRGDRPVVGTVSLSQVDTAQLSSEVPGSLALTGLANGEARFRVIGNTEGPEFQAEAVLTASEMTVGGIPARSLRATLTAHRGVSTFEGHAESLDGSIVVKGSSGTNPGDPLEADLKAVGFKLGALAPFLGRTASCADVRGLGAIAARFRSKGSSSGWQADGTAEVRGLKLGEHYDLGHLRAGFAFTPDAWRVGHLKGSFWKSPVVGEFWRQGHGSDPADYGLDLRLERIALDQFLAFHPDLGQRFDGVASIIAKGRSRGSFRGKGEFRVERGHLNRLPLVGFSVPVEWDVRPDAGFRGTVRVRNASAHIAGGQFQADATVRLGLEHRLHSEMTLEQIDIRTISRVESRAGRPIPGRIDGVVILDSPNLGRLHDYTGRIDLDLTRAALLDIPILDGLDSALGSAQGAVFDDGDLHAEVAQGAVHVSRLTLVGPLAQLHATGTVGLDGRLDLRAFVNTNNTLPTNLQVAIGRFSSAADDVRQEARRIDRMADFLSSRLLKFHVSGTLAHPVYAMDGSLRVDKVALAFFVEAMKFTRRQASR